MRDVTRRRLLIGSGAALLAPASTPSSAQGERRRPEQAKVALAVGGKPALFYLPLTVTERLGYFKDEGLDVEISDFPGGGRALQALIGGSADVVAGAYDHTIQMHAKGQPIVAVVQLGRYPGFVLGVLSAKAQAYRGPADLKGMKIGITAPGSSTHFMALYLMAKAGLTATDASFIGVGVSASAVAAVRRGEIDALINVDPVISLLEQQGLITVVADTRTEAGSRAVYGGALPAAVLYAPPAFISRNPNTTQALVNALVRGLRWMQASTPEAIADVMPAEYALGDKALYAQVIGRSQAMYSPDGRFDPDAEQTAYNVLRQFDPALQGSNLDVRKTYSNAFVDRAPR